MTAYSLNIGVHGRHASRLIHIPAEIKMICIHIGWWPFQRGLFADAYSSGGSAQEKSSQ
jgi:hypothetical protein